MDFQDAILKALKKQTGRDLPLEIPPDENMGDYALPCFLLSKALKKNPAEIAKDLSEKLTIKNITIEAMGPYLNFFVDKTLLAENTLQAAMKKNYGKGKKKGTIVIDYSQPNVAKHMGIHNLRSTIIGHALLNIHKHLGYKVVGINYIGDWGTNFGQLIVGVKRWSSEEKIKKDGVKELNRIYVKFHQEAEKTPSLEIEARAAFEQLDKGDAGAKKFWKLFRDVSLADYQKMYDRLNISFDEIKGEAAAVPHIPKLLEQLKKKKLLKEDDGAKIVELNDMPPCLILKSDGASTYATRDLATALERFKDYKPTQMLYVVDVAQKLHFEQVFGVLKKLTPKEAKKVEHIAFGRLSFPDKAMSTRKGNIIILEDVLDKAEEKVLKIIKAKNPKLTKKEERARAIANGAIIFFDLFHDRVKNIIFTWDAVLDFEGDSGPYVQYTHARCCSLLAKHKGKISKSIRYDLLTEDEPIAVIKLIDAFPALIETCAEARKPSLLAKYLIDLSRAFNTFYRAHQVLGEDKEITAARILLVAATQKVLADGLMLLHIHAPEEM